MEDFMSPSAQSGRFLSDTVSLFDSFLQVCFEELYYEPVAVESDQG